MACAQKVSVSWPAKKVGAPRPPTDLDQVRLPTAHDHDIDAEEPPCLVRLVLAAEWVPARPLPQLGRFIRPFKAAFQDCACGFFAKEIPQPVRLAWLWLRLTIEP